MFLFVVSTLALLIVSLTMLARANDLRWKKGLHWNVRLAGFILAGFAPVGIVGAEWLMDKTPSVYDTLFRVGIALVFMTTPYLPPWWRWLWGLDGSSAHHAPVGEQPGE